MADKQELARDAFDTFCRMLDKNNWRYFKDESKLSIQCNVQSKDLPMELRIFVDADRMIVLLLSQLNFKVQDDKRLDMAVAACHVNNMMADGSFDYDVKTGDMYFRMTHSFQGNVLDELACGYIVACSCQTIDAFNEKFFMLATGMQTLQQFLEANS